MSLKAFEATFYDFITTDPNNCIYLGIEKNLGELPDPGKNKRITTQGKIKLLNKMLNQISQDELSFDEKIDYKLYRLYLEQERLYLELEIDNYPQIMRMPKASSIISDPLFMLFANDERDPKLRLVNIISRLEKVDGFITSYCRNINNPVKRWVEMELDSLAGLTDFFKTLLNWAIDLDFKNLPRFEKAIQSACSALSRYKAFLLNSSVSNNIHLGEEQMLAVIKSRGIELSPKELHHIAKEFTAKNQKEVLELKDKLINKYELDSSTSTEELQEFLARKYKVQRSTEDFSYILTRYKDEAQKIEKFIKERNLFPLNIDQEMNIIQTPSFMVPSIPAGAMLPPLPMRDGIKKSIIYLTLSENLLDEHTEISIPSMMIHEGIPGHHLQFSWASNNTSFIRKVFNANDLSEGWTTMLEDYMLDIGYSPMLADEIRFITKRDIARIGARVAIDLYFMSGNKAYLDIGVECDLSNSDPFICAGSLLKSVTGFVDERIQGELNWYSQERGYPLSYLTGNYLAWDLKNEFFNKFKDLNDADFHQRYLSAGNMPLSVLKEILLRD